MTGARKGDNIIPVESILKGEMLPVNNIKLDKIADVQVGYQSRSRIDESLNGPFQMIRPQDVDSNGLALDSFVRFFPDDSIDPIKYLVQKGNILLQARGNNHTAVMVHQDLEQTVASNSFYIIKHIDSTRILPEFLAWWLNQPQSQNYFVTEQGLSTIPFLSIRSIQKTKIFLPPLSIQADISALMDLWGREQKLTKQILNNKEILIQALANRQVLNTTEEK